MAENDTSMRAIGPSISGVSTVKPFASPLRSKKRGKSKRKNLSATSRTACSPPDLDIVSGFAFLSFSTVEDLECHIEDHEVNTRSLSINVGEKRKKSAPKQQKGPNYTADGGDFVHSKRIKTPSQKILESYATADLNLNKIRPTVPRELLKRTKIRPFPGSKATSTSSLKLDSSSFLDPSDLKERDEYFPPPNIDLTVKETNASEISLECSERISLFDDEPKQEAYPLSESGIELACSTATGTEVPEKKKKKKKRKRDKTIHDQTCQTMFRIKKKKKDSGENTVNSTKSEEKQNESSSSKIENEIIEENPISSTLLRVEACSPEITGDEVIECEKIPSSSFPMQNETTPSGSISSMPTETNVIEEEGSITQVEEEIYSPPVPQPQITSLSVNDVKVHRLKVSNKVEKIDYCARSGGVRLVERHHERQNKYKQEESSENVSCGQQVSGQWENDLHGSSSCDVNNGADNLSEYSGNDSSNNSSYGDQETLMNVKSRIFAGSTSVFISSLDESNDTSDIDIESNEADASKPMIDIVKALPKSYLFGHLSSFPDKTTQGTIDVSIQVYENDIQLYMNYAADFKGKIIKIIVPDNEDSKSSCYLKSSYLSGLPKFLQPQEYVKAVRSATERNRRHTIGDLFHQLKNELYHDVRDFYFSKQAILTKAIETIETCEVEGQLLESEKNMVGMENQELRSRLNTLLFGEDLDDDKMLDLDKVTEHLKTLGIKIEIPPKESDKDGKISQGTESNKPDDNARKQQKKHVTRKGRPPSERKLLKSLQTDSQAKLPKIPKPRELSNYVKAAFNNKMKEFVAIAPSDNKETPSVDQNTVNEAVKTSGSSVDTRESIPHTTTSDAVNKNPASDSSVNKIVCNLTKYRIHQQPRSSGNLTIITNPEPLKEIESKDVVHIKISNDSMKHIGIIPRYSASNTSSKNSVSPSIKDVDKQDSVGTDQSALCNSKESQGASKPTDKVSTVLDISKNPSSVAAVGTKCTFVHDKLEALTPENGKNTSIHNVTSKNEEMLVPSKEKTYQVGSNQSQPKNTENIESTEGTADAGIASLSQGEPSCSKENVSKEVKVPPHSSKDTTVSKETTKATEEAPASKRSKSISEEGSAAVTTCVMAKLQCSSQVSVSQTLPQHQSEPAMQKKNTANKPLQGTPLFTLAKVQQNKVVPTSRVQVTTMDNISIQNKPATSTNQVVTTKINTLQTLKKIPVTAKPATPLPVLKMKQLRPAPLATQQNVTLLPIATTTMATQGTHMLQMTPTTLAKVVPSQSISMLPTMTTNVTMVTHSTGMVQMMPAMGSKLVTPQNIAVLPLSTNVTMATHSKPIQITPSTVTKLVAPIQTTAATQSITVLPMGAQGKPIIQVPQGTASKVVSPQGITVSSSPMTQPPVSGYVALVRTPSPNTPPAVSQKAFIVPNSSLAGTSSPLRIVFKPTGQQKIFSTPFPQIKSALQSSSIIGQPNAKAAPSQQINTSVSTSMTTHPTGTLNTKVLFKDKVPVTNKQVSVQNTGNANNIPVQYKHLIMKAPPLQVVSVSQPPQTKTLVRVQQATPAPIQSSVSSVPEQPTKASTPLTELVHLSSEGKDFANKPSSTIGVPVQSSASTVRQLLVSGSMNTPVRLQDPSSIHPKVHTNVAIGGRLTTTFNTAVPQSVALQTSSPRLASHSNQDKERGPSEAQVSQIVTPQTTSVLTGLVGSKDTFSEIEKILAKIPSPKVTNSITSSSGNAPCFSAPMSIARPNTVLLSRSQNLGYSPRAINQVVVGNIDAATPIRSMDGQVFNSVVRPQQIIADTQCSPKSQMITNSSKSPPFTSVSNRDRTPCTNSPSEEATRSTSDSVTFSSTCSSTAASFDNPKPKEDKTCSVVDSPEVVSHMVSADTLSVCNIESSIPDIASELPSQINPAPSVKPPIKEWLGNKEASLPTKGTNVVEKKSGHDFDLQEKSIADEFHLLTSFEWNNNTTNKNSAVSSPGHAYKTGDT